MESLISILAVDDHEPDLVLISEALTTAAIAGFKLFSNAKDFLVEVEKANCPICIIDHKLGSQLGYDVMLEVKRLISCAYIIILSGIEDAYKLIEYSNAGANKIVLKQDGDYLIRLIDYVKAGITFQQQAIQLAKEIRSI